jgi:hypothetical protein
MEGRRTLVSESRQKRYSVNFWMCRNVQMPFPGACIRPMAVLSNDQVYKFTILTLSVVVGLSYVNVTRDCMAYKNCIVPNLVFPTGVQTSAPFHSIQV